MAAIVDALVLGVRGQGFQFDVNPLGFSIKGY